MIKKSVQRTAGILPLYDARLRSISQHVVGSQALVSADNHVPQIVNGKFYTVKYRRAIREKRFVIKSDQVASLEVMTTTDFTKSDIQSFAQSLNLSERTRLRC